MSPGPRATSVLARAGWPLRALFVLAFIFTVEHARPVLLPIVVAVVFTLMLAPAVRKLRRLGVTEAIGAALVVTAVLAGLALIGSSLTGPALSWWERAPQNLQQLSDAIDRLRSSMPFLAPPAPQAKGARPARNAPPVQPPPDPLKDRLASESVAFTRVLLLQFTSFAVSAAATVMLLYFLLASERWLIARTVQAIPRRRARGLLLSGVRRAQRDIAYFFATQLLINCGVGIAVTATSWWLGLPNPVLWGIATGVLNFIPYLGPMAAAVMMLLAGVLTFDTLPAAVAPTLAMIVVHAIETNVVSPLVVSRRLELNPLAVFIAVLLWGWLWGIPGALIAVPVLLCLRIACHRIRAMRKWAAYLDRGGDIPSLRSLLRAPLSQVRPATHRVGPGIVGAGAARQAPKDDL
ncbi:MAG TPA: AI-2E family transporter [Burkholderiaceae bacterium]|nr:AI-2E family transporter [Burkholderiaceae bacterium]